MRVLPSKKARLYRDVLRHYGAVALPCRLGEPRTTTRTAPPGRRKVSSCSSAQHRALDLTVREWTHLPL
jgi:hypothetical protein